MMWHLAGQAVVSTLKKSHIEDVPDVTRLILICSLLTRGLQVDFIPDNKGFA